MSALLTVLSSGSGGDAVLVEQPTDPVRSLHPGTAVEGVNGGVGDWRLEIDPAVRARVVVVKDELPEHPVELAFTADEHPVEALGPRRPDKAFGESVRSGRPDGRPDDPGANRPHHLVEGPDELGVPVTDQEPYGPALVL